MGTYRRVPTGSSAPPSIAPTPAPPRTRSYLPSGFILNNTQVEGPVLCLPETWLLWDAPARVAALDMASLPVLDLMAPPPEVLVVGCGARLTRLPEGLARELRARGVAVEVLDTVRWGGAVRVGALWRDRGRLGDRGGPGGQGFVCWPCGASPARASPPLADPLPPPGPARPPRPSPSGTRSATSTFSTTRAASLWGRCCRSAAATTARVALRGECAACIGFLDCHCHLLCRLRQLPLERLLQDGIC